MTNQAFYMCDVDSFSFYKHVKSVDFNRKCRKRNDLKNSLKLDKCHLQKHDYQTTKNVTIHIVLRIGIFSNLLTIKNNNIKQFFMYSSILTVFQLF